MNTIFLALLIGHTLNCGDVELVQINKSGSHAYGVCTENYLAEDSLEGCFDTSADNLGYYIETNPWHFQNCQSWED